MDLRRMFAAVTGSTTPTLYELARSTQALGTQILALGQILNGQAAGSRAVLEGLATAGAAQSKDLATILGKFSEVETLARDTKALAAQIQTDQIDERQAVLGMLAADLQVILAAFATEKIQLDRIEKDLNAPPPADGIATSAAVTLSGRGIVSTTAGKKGSLLMATVVNTGGPLKFDVSHFVDDAGNPVTDTDPATYTSSDPTVATVANDPADMQDGIITLTKKNTAPGVACVITASFPAQTGGMPFAVTGNLIVIDPAAAGAQAVITGPGVVAGA